MQLIDAQTIDTKGGSIRVMVQHANGPHRPAAGRAQDRAERQSEQLQAAREMLARVLESADE